LNSPPTSGCHTARITLQFIDYEALEDIYTNTDNILFEFQPKDKSVFTRESLGIVKRLSEKA
jgi:hypothetical protein